MDAEHKCDVCLKLECITCRCGSKSLCIDCHEEYTSIFEGWYYKVTDFSNDSPFYIKSFADIKKWNKFLFSTPEEKENA